MRAFGVVPAADQRQISDAPTWRYFWTITMLTLTPWNTGAPERVGWYNASRERNPEAWRYHDGNAWSALCKADDPEAIMDRARATRAVTQDGIEHRGLTEQGAGWLAAELEREPATA